MFWHQKWRALSTRIDGLKQAAEYVAQALTAANKSDSFRIVQKWIAAELWAILEELEQFKASYQTQVPPDALQVLARLLKRDWLDKRDRLADHPELINASLVSIGALATFRSSFEYLLQDTEIEAQSRTELAFEHLRRVILVDGEVRDKWRRHYDESGEAGCEKLGSVHLLSHGILAFKVSGQRGVTDLAFNEPLQPDDPITAKVARAIVLTEWKVAKTSSEVERRAKEARAQVREYVGGVFGTLELTRTRYIIILSKESIHPPCDFLENEIKYRHIALSLSPSTPSKAARKRARTNPGS